MARRTKFQKYVDDNLENYESHIGHTVQYYSGGHTDNYGVLKRVTVDYTLKSIVLWLGRKEKNVFQTKVFDSQLVGCSCGEGRKNGNG